MDSKEKKCSSSQVFNPTTGRCVLKTGKIGQGILIKKAYSRKGKKLQSIKGSEPCPSSKILNPTTGRCVLKTGKVGQGIFKIPLESVLPKYIKKYKNGYNVIRRLIEGYSITEKVGVGTNGIAFLLTNNTNPSDERIFKITRIKSLTKLKETEKEIFMQRKFSTILNICPQIYSETTIFDKTTRTGFSIILMERMPSTLEQLLFYPIPAEYLDLILDSLVKLINILCENNLIHGDIHPGNISVEFIKDPFASMSNHTGMRANLKLLDFGLSCCKQDVRCNPPLEYIQMILVMLFDKKNYNHINRKYLLPKLIAQFNKYNPDYKLKEPTSSEKEIIAMYNRIYDEYIPDMFDNPRMWR